MRRPKGLYIMSESAFDQVYGTDEREEIEKLVDIYAPPQSADSVARNPELLADAEIILGGWGTAKMDEGLLDAAPNLKIMLYSAGSVRAVVTDASWDRGIIICSAWVANGVSVAEYALSQILWCLKLGWHYALSVKREGRWVERIPVPGAYGSTVGLISLGAVSRTLCGLLKSFAVNVIAYDPFVSDGAARELNVELCSLDDVFRRSDVVSLHAPLLEETTGMVRGRHFEMMKPYASFINTSRGAVIRELGMIEVLRKRPDLFAVLDVTDPEPPAAGSPLYTLPNVITTPHIAGSMDHECRRMARYMIDELKRYLAGEQLQWAINRDQAILLA